MEEKYAQFNAILESQETFDNAFFELNERGLNRQTIVFDILNHGTQKHVDRMTHFVSSIRFKFIDHIHDHGEMSLIFFKKHIEANNLFCERFPGWINDFIHEDAYMFSSNDLESETAINYYLSVTYSIFELIVLCCSRTMRYDECFQLLYYLSSFHDDEYFPHEEISPIIDILLNDSDVHNVAGFVEFMIDRYGFDDFVWSAKGKTANVCELFEMNMNQENRLVEKLLTKLNTNLFREKYESRFELHHQEIIINLVYFGSTDFLRFLLVNKTITIEHLNATIIAMKEEKLLHQASRYQIRTTRDLFD